MDHEATKAAIRVARSNHPAASDAYAAVAKRLDARLAEKEIEEPNALVETLAEAVSREYDVDYEASVNADDEVTVVWYVDTPRP